MEYNLEFSRKLFDTAKLLVSEGLDSFEANQTVVYLSLLSCEISLKALLERSGLPVSTIRSKSHDLEKLINLLTIKCEVEVDIAKGHLMWCSAARIRGRQIHFEGTTTVAGRVLSGEKQGASKYPNEIRYGSRFRSFPPHVLLGTAETVIGFADEHWETIRVKMDKINSLEMKNET